MEEKIPLFKEQDPRENLKKDILKFLIDLWANTPFVKHWSNTSHKKLYEFSQDFNVTPEGQTDAFRVSWNKVPSLDELKEFREYFAKIVIKHNMNYLIDRDNCIVHRVYLNPILPRDSDQIIEVIVDKECIWVKDRGGETAYVTPQQAVSMGYYNSMADLLYSITTPSVANGNHMVINDKGVYLNLPNIVDIYRRARDKQKEIEEKKRYQNEATKKSRKKITKGDLYEK